MKNNLIKLFSLLGKQTNETTNNVLELLKKGKSDEQIKQTLKITFSKIHAIKKDILTQLKEYFKPFGVKITTFPSDHDAEYLLKMKEKIIVVAYCKENFNYDEVDDYLTHLEKHFEIIQISNCTGEYTDLRERVITRLEKTNKSFSMLLGDNFSELIKEGEKLKKEPHSHMSVLYSNLNPRSTPLEILSLSDEIKKFNEKSA